MNIINDLSLPKTILIAEDEEFNFFVLEQLLTIRDYTIIHVKNGKEAIEYCHSNENVSLIFMDIRMPIMDGYEATKQIKQFRPNLPIIAHTAFAHPEDIQKGLKLGFDDYMTKPVDTDILFKIIDKNI